MKAGGFGVVQLAVLSGALALLQPGWEFVPSAQADDAPRQAPVHREKRPPRLDVPPDVAALAGFSVILGRPSRHSVTASLLSQVAGEAYVAFTPAPGQPEKRTELVSLPVQQPRHVQLAPLAADQQISRSAIAYIFGRQVKKPLYPARFSIFIPSACREAPLSLNCRATPTRSGGSSSTRPGMREPCAGWPPMHRTFTS